MDKNCQLKTWKFISYWSQKHIMPIMAGLAVGIRRKLLLISMDIQIFFSYIKLAIYVQMLSYSNLLHRNMLGYRSYSRHHVLIGDNSTNSLFMVHQNELTLYKMFLDQEWNPSSSINLISNQFYRIFIAIFIGFTNFFVIKTSKLSSKCNLPSLEFKENMSDIGGISLKYVHVSKLT